MFKIEENQKETSYKEYLEEHKENIGDKFPPIPEAMYDEREFTKYNFCDFDYR